ncbi:MarR family winged helix-turn-helix transcriptional regulator [Allokutzneria oryzae]|uniref:MarR family winged helix-turn-helix transcriptional regulator n=1 Tax=Allokutzneria oryzae TaxID=1378989 RepID=A0ABV6A672_9PSEU
MSELEQQLTLFARKAVWRSWSTGYRGLDHVTYPYLVAVALKGGARVGDLARQFGVDKSTASRHVAKLLAAGLVEPVENPPDARSVPLCATSAGLRLLTDVQAERAAWLRRALSGWDERDQRTLAALMARLNAGLESSE